MGGAPNAGSACVVSRVDGRVGCHYAWLRVGGQLRTLVLVRSGRGPLIWHARAPIQVCGSTDRRERSELLAGASRRSGTVPDIDPQACECRGHPTTMGIRPKSRYSLLGAKPQPRG
jgi:hypothetical protein